MKNILAIGAHFDDVELGAGGTLAKLANEGVKVYKLTLTDNVTSFSQLNINVKFEKTKKESLEACKILGIEQLEPNKYLPCTHLEYTTQNMQMVEKIIFELNIDTLFSHYIGDIQQDHVAAAKITYVAARYCPRLLFYQSNRYLLPLDYYPRFFSDITNYSNKKFKALNCYKGDHDRLSKLFSQTRIQNELWGYQMNMKESKSYFAEGFIVHKWTI